jgi:uncharacterized DUF497 family protein
MHVVWDPEKRQTNLDEHGLGFIDAVAVLDSLYRLDVQSARNQELRTQSLACVFDVLAVLTVMHVSRENSMRIISFRPASEIERTADHDWLENDFYDER